MPLVPAVAEGDGDVVFGLFAESLQPVIVMILRRRMCTCMIAPILQNPV